MKVDKQLEKIANAEEKLEALDSFRYREERKNNMMDGLEIVSKMQILIKDRLQSVGDTMITGGVDNMEKYQYMLGQARLINIYYRKSLTC